MRSRIIAYLVALALIGPTPWSVDSYPIPRVLVLSAGVEMGRVIPLEMQFARRKYFRRGSESEGFENTAASAGGPVFRSLETTADALELVGVVSEGGEALGDFVSWQVP